MRLCEAISPRYQIQQQNKALLLAQPAKTTNKLKDRQKQAKTVAFVTVDLVVIAVAEAVLLLLW